MTKNQVTLRSFPAGTAASGKTVTFKKEADDTTITSDTTDSDGQAQYAANGSPGPFYWSATDATPDPDVTRAGSSRSYGSGGSYSLYELPYALRAMGDGVIDGLLNELAVTYDAAGLDLDVATGGAVIAGVPAIFYDVTDFTSVGTRDATNPKACYLVVEVSPPGQSDEGRAELKSVCGTAAASPALPSLTNDETLRQYALASYRLPNTSSTTLTNVTDLRTFLLQPTARNPVVSSVVRRVDSTEAATTSTTGADVTSLTTTLTLVNGVIYDIEARALLVGKISTSAQTWQIAPYITGTSEIATYITNNNTDFAALGNVHTLEGVTGTGASISLGLRAKVSGGTMTYQAGYLMCRAVPRT